MLGLGTLDPPDAVAIMPAGAPSAGDTVDLETEDDLTLPLVVLWPAGAPSPAVRRISAALATP